LIIGNPKEYGQVSALSSIATITEENRTTPHVHVSLLDLHVLPYGPLPISEKTKKLVGQEWLGANLLETVSQSTTILKSPGLIRGDRWLPSTAASPGA
jgi:hypothetical protein